MVVWALSAVGAGANPLPSYDGVMTFQSIQGPDGPEEFSWVVTLAEGQELREIDDRHAAVYYESGHIAFSIEARAAHAADGADVPTTLSVTRPNAITLIVHHRSGNPAAGGAPFDYPVDPGEGWEEFQSQEISGSAPPVISLMPQVPFVSEPHCEVPKLKWRYLPRLLKLLERHGCTLGEVRGRRGAVTRVIRQFPRPETLLPLGAKVDIRVRPSSSAGVRALS
jgi:hypothetical protein